MLISTPVGAGIPATGLGNTNWSCWSKLTALAGLFFLASASAQAQAPAWSWVANSTKSGPAVVEKVATDALGNAYVTGRFTKQVNFGTHILQSAGSSDVFIAKVSADGKWEWAVSAGGPQVDLAAGIVVDAQGNIIVAGSFSDNALFGLQTRQSHGDKDIFVARLSATGQWLSVTTAGGKAQDQVFALAIDAQDNVFVGGRYSGDTSFGTKALHSGTSTDAFIAKLGPRGEWLWAKQTAGSTQTVINRLTVDTAGDVYAAGYFEGNTQVGGTMLVSAGTHDALVAKISGAGVWQWAAQGGGESTDYAKGITVSATGSVFVTGTFSGQATFGGTTLASAGGDDAYVAQLSAQGKWQWVKPLKGTALENGADICQGVGESVYVAGSFSPGAYYGTASLASKGNIDVYVARFSNSGECLDIASAGSIGRDEASTVSLAPNGQVYVGGIVGVAATFGASPVGETTPQVFVGRLQFPARLAADIQQASR